MSADNNIDLWLKRFRAFDAQEEETVDDSEGYRKLLRQGSEAPARAQSDTKARPPKRQDGRAI